MAELVHPPGLSESGILCPRSSGLAMAPQHRALREAADALYDAMKPHRDDDTGECGEPLDTVYSKTVYETYRYNEHMFLMYDNRQLYLHGQALTLITAWWECRTCGAIVAATATETPLGRVR